MFISPPRTILPLPRAIFLNLLLIGGLISPPTEAADSFSPQAKDVMAPQANDVMAPQAKDISLPPKDSAAKLQIQIPPGMDDLDGLQAAYEEASKNLEARLREVVEKSPACASGAAMAEALKKAPAAQAHQRKKIVDALNLSKLELQTKVAELDGAAADRSPASLSVVAVAKDAIDTGAAKPLEVIAAEQKKIKKHNERMQATVGVAATALDGTALRCQEAYKAYFDQAKPLALEIPVKLGRVEAGLKAHTEALHRWADAVGRSTAGR